MTDEAKEEQEKIIKLREWWTKSKKLPTSVYLPPNPQAPPPDFYQPPVFEKWQKEWEKSKQDWEKSKKDWKTKKDWYDQKQKDLYKDPMESLRKAAEAAAQRAYEETKRRMLEEAVNKIVEEVMKANPHMNETTRTIAKEILRLYPKLDKCDAYDMIIPFVFSVAADIQKEIDKLIPEEFK